MVALQVAVRNAGRLFRGGVEPYSPTPSDVISDGPHRRLLRFRRPHAAATSGNPILLVPPLAVTITCYDIRPSQSLVRFLMNLGREVYVIDYGDITYADRHLGFEEWVDDIVPTAINQVSAAHADSPVDVVGWSFGGTLSLLTAAAHPQLPIGSVTAVGSPFDQRRNGSISLTRQLGQLTDGREVTTPVRLAGMVPKQVVRLGFRIQSLDRELTKPWFIARNIDNTESLARMQAFDRFLGEMPGYPGRFYRQAHRQLIVRNEMYQGTVSLSPYRSIELAKLSTRVLLIGGSRDKLAAAAAVAAGTEVLTGAQEVRFVEVDGSHLGMIAGPEARDSTWAAIAEFLGR